MKRVIRIQQGVQDMDIRRRCMNSRLNSLRIRPLISWTVSRCGTGLLVMATSSFTRSGGMALTTVQESRRHSGEDYTSNFHPHSVMEREPI
jgi:hypothetical protein